jgi:14-3-3 protein epsilon
MVEDLVYEAELAEQAERYAHMSALMMTCIQQAPELSAKIRNLFNISSRNVLLALRFSWLTLRSIEIEETAKGNDLHVQLAGQYLEKIEGEMHGVMSEYIAAIEEALSSRQNTPDCSISLLRMKGDFYRMMSELHRSAWAVSRRTAAEHSQSSYKQAMQLANAVLPPTSPLRLSMALSLATFHYDFKGDPATSRRIAQDALDLAVAEIDDLPDDEYRDSTLLMQTLRDNIVMWTEPPSSDGGC